MPSLIKDHDEVPLVVHSKVTGPVENLSFLEKSLLFAELSMVSYNDEAEATRAAIAIGFPDVTLFDNDGSQAFRFRNDNDCIIACRGTEPNEWNDIQADVDATAVLAETVGKVHRGFKKEVDDLWPELETALTDNDLPLWFCGHSLGGAMATISAGRCFLSHIACNPSALFTYGSPRVGDNAYVNYVELDHYRWVNNNDIVTRVPPAWLGYRHAGQEVYLNRNGIIRKLTGMRRFMDRARGFARGLRRWKIDHFSDHSIHNYIDAILPAAQEDASDRRHGEAATKADELAMPAPEPKGEPTDSEEAVR
ncbi:Lipase (class 3) [Roseimaritima multifibrata]|uniref:Lipase (Class 3) n=1 Tax=Roseimaritima multifibrata TaxID=1930274 RepID=A0A517MDD5_9BACT|nr:lipase family protein [Roseimaritima multifibrata]QDS92892.1 Lipase (class 3) [Roseimaritima multifibrata]